MVSEIQYWPGWNLPLSNLMTTQVGIWLRTSLLGFPCCRFHSHRKQSIGCVFSTRRTSITGFISRNSKIMQDTGNMTVSEISESTEAKAKEQPVAFLLRISCDKKIQRKACRVVTNCWENVSLTEKYYPFFIRNSSEYVLLLLWLFSTFAANVWAGGIASIQGFTTTIV